MPLGVAYQKAAFHDDLTSLIRRIADLPAEQIPTQQQLIITSAEALVLDILCEHAELTQSEIDDFAGVSCFGKLLRLRNRSLLTSRKRTMRSVLWSITPLGRKAACTPQSWAKG